MTMNLSPYVRFQDNAREALTFYKSILGGTLTLSTFGEYDDSLDEATGSLIMHGELETDADFIILASDTPAPMPFDPGARISLAIFGDNEFKMAEYYNALLSQGGSTQMPLEKAPWGDSFGMVTDHYGVNWMFNISGANHGD
ncbi:VOC family protein [Jonesiaceae bacterium BS-20]|uniref:VOC family protein n=1 Tax=Jonesiaceae bacterium BS-20 TaxID=3120821 RepID=A0AAU7DU72_9MICO